MSRVRFPYRTAGSKPAPPIEGNRRESVTTKPKGSGRLFGQPPVVATRLGDTATEWQHRPTLCSAWIPLSRAPCPKAVEAKCRFASTSSRGLTGESSWKMQRTRPLKQHSACGCVTGRLASLPEGFFRLEAVGRRREGILQSHLRPPASGLQPNVAIESNR